eukprot:1037070-Rhodomonas_salina.1
MHHIITQASRRRSNRVCVNPSSSGLPVSWDSVKRRRSNSTFVCELWCPPTNQSGSCITYRNCYSNHSSCTWKEVGLCHFQYSKGVINKQLREMSAPVRDKFLHAEALFFDATNGLHLPKREELECKRRLLRARQDQ